MDELQENLSRLLEDPAELERLGRMASELLGGGEAASDAAAAPDLKSVLSGLQNAEHSNTQKLLQAMQPFLAPKRQQKLRRALRVARLASVAGQALGSMKEDDEDEPILWEHGTP